MTTQHITEHSPASAWALEIISQCPGVSTSTIAQRGGWSVYHVRNVLRHLRRIGRVRSERANHHGECQWWPDSQSPGSNGKTSSERKPKPKPAPIISSVFALGAAA